MNKETRAKVEAFIKEHEKRELSIEELDKVAGGADAHDVVINGKYYTEEFILELMYNMTNEFGFDIAFDTFCEWTGFSKNEKPKSGSDWDRMSVVLCEFWKVHGRLRESGHSY